MAETLRHKKTGGLYEVLSRSAVIHSDVPLSDDAPVTICRRLPDGQIVARFGPTPRGTFDVLHHSRLQTDVPRSDGAEVVVYRALGGGPVWARPSAEMDDGRFEAVPFAPAGAPQAALPVEGEGVEQGASPDGVGLTLRALHAANIARQAEWCPDQLPDLSFRGNELAGEAGEASEVLILHAAELGKLAGRTSNVIKKLERERHGWRGSRATLGDLAQELADVVICADLCAVTAGIDLDAAVVAKFNATSEKQGLRTMLPAPTPDANSGGEAAGSAIPEGWTFAGSLSKAAGGRWQTTLRRIADGHVVTAGSVVSQDGAHAAACVLARRTPGLRLAEGCCSAVSPCSHQKRSPYTICDICQRATNLSAAPHPSQEKDGQL